MTGRLPMNESKMVAVARCPVAPLSPSPELPDPRECRVRSSVENHGRSVLERRLEGSPRL